MKKISEIKNSLDELNSRIEKAKKSINLKTDEKKLYNLKNGGGGGGVDIKREQWRRKDDGLEQREQERRRLESPGELELGVPEEAGCRPGQREHPGLGGKKPPRTGYARSGLREESKVHGQGSQARHIRFRSGSSNDRP